MMRQASYELSVDGGPVMESSQEQADGQKKTRLSQGEGKTTLQVGQAPSFEGTNLLSQDSVRLDGSIKADLSVSQICTFLADWKTARAVTSRIV